MQLDRISLQSRSIDSLVRSESIKHPQLSTQREMSGRID